MITTTKLRTPYLVQTPPSALLGDLGFADNRKEAVFLKKYFTVETYLSDVVFHQLKAPSDYLLLCLGNAKGVSEKMVAECDSGTCHRNLWIVPKQHSSAFVTKVVSSFQKQFITHNMAPSENMGVMIAVWDGGDQHALVGSLSSIEEGLLVEQDHKIHNQFNQRHLFCDGNDEGLEDIWEHLEDQAQLDPSFPLRDAAMLLKNVANHQSLIDHLARLGKQRKPRPVPNLVKDEFLPFRYLLDFAPSALLQSIISSEDINNKLGVVPEKSNKTNRKL